MAEHTAIEWCDHTFNPWIGCQKVGPGCDNCYAEAADKRFTGARHWGPRAPRRRTSPANWRLPLRWNRAAEKAGRRARVFCASWADVFDNAVPPEWRDDLFRLIASTPHLDWLLLTKRPGNIAAMLPFGWGAGWHNVWLGCTVVNQTEADRDIPKLLATPAAVRFLSMEPLLGPVDLRRIAPGQVLHGNRDHEYVIHALLGGIWDQLMRVPDRDGARIDWVIVGGESGPNARPMHPDWARSLRDQCVAAGVAFHFKQQGEWSWGGFAPNPGSCGPKQAAWILPDGSWRASDESDAHLFCEALGSVHVLRVGKARAGRLLDGREWTEFPATVAEQLGGGNG